MHPAATITLKRDFKDCEAMLRAHPGMLRNVTFTPEVIGPYYALVVRKAPTYPFSNEELNLIPTKFNYLINVDDRGLYLMIWHRNP
jgi:hypothetical protein